ncbi:hypothetical protein MBLNU230_g5298t1 [Neophaeotheca triangularis]
MSSQPAPNGTPTPPPQPTLPQSNNHPPLLTASGGINNLASSLKPSPADPNNPSSQTEATQKVKPCCVCKDEKSARDECMLFSSAADPQEDCKGMVEKYRGCMKGFGFNV